MQEKSVLIARRAIVDAHGRTKAYSILYPSSKTAPPDSSIRLLHSLFSDLDIQQVTDNTMAFIDIEAGFLANPPPFSLGQYALFFELPATLPEEFVEHLELLRDDGYQLGLVNPEPDRLSAALLEPIKFIRLDYDKLSASMIEVMTEAPEFDGKTLVAGGLKLSQHTRHAMDNPRFALFSGDQLDKEENVAGHQTPVYRSLIIELLTKMNTPMLSLRDLASIIERDATLSYKMIRLTKCAKFYRDFQVSSVQRALEVIGLRDLMRWFGMALLASIEGKPDCLYKMAVTRALFCQNLGEKLFPREENAFLVGLFSFLPEFFGENLMELLEDIPLDDKLKLALLEQKGPLGSLLKIVKQYESGQWLMLPLDKMAEMGVDRGDLRQIYLNSINMAKEYQF